MKTIKIKIEIDGKPTREVGIDSRRHLSFRQVDNFLRFIKKEIYKT